jgi:hypothetical protein
MGVGVYSGDLLAPAGSKFKTDVARSGIKVEYLDIPE